MRLDFSLTRFSRSQKWLLLTFVLITLASNGCVRRRLTVRSNPPGATVFIDNQPIGKTPCSVDFTYYGTREIRLVKNGYETLTVNQPIPAPWYQVPPLDFFSDNLWPIPIRDNRTVEFPLSPQRLQSVDEILSRGGELRGRMRSEIPATGATNPSGPTPVTVIQPGVPPLAPNNPVPVFEAPPSLAPGTTVAPGGGAATFGPTTGPTISPNSTEPVPSPIPFRY